MKKEKHEEPQKVEVESSRSQEELVPPPTPEPDVDPDEDLELSGEGEDDAPEEKNGEIVRCGQIIVFIFALLSLKPFVVLVPIILAYEIHLKCFPDSVPRFLF